MLGLDFETFSEVDIRKHGLDRYVNHPSFRVLLTSVDYPDGRKATIDWVRHGRDDKLNARESTALLAGRGVMAAHNAPFERAVCKRVGIDISTAAIVDSAVVARAMGAGSKLEAAAPQLLGTDKMEEGHALIKLFSMPQKDGTIHVDNFDTWTDDMRKQWATFIEYCELDAHLSRRIYSQYADYLVGQERNNEWVTHLQNTEGWRVDLDLVHAMQQQYFSNLVEIENAFRTVLDPDGKINFRSPQQLAKYCKDRNVRVTSLDEQHLARYLGQVKAELERRGRGEKWRGRSTTQQLQEVLWLLTTKQQLGGSSLTKLQTIIDMTGTDGRLRGQYLHVGAGQTYRTSGRGVQMQNLKRLGPEPDPVEVLLDPSGDFDEWDNQRLARNLRQVFTATHPNGRLIVGDFSAVESRGLAYLAGEKWKLDAYRKGQDLYKVLAAKMLDTTYETVDKAQRQQGKVGELSCGYGAGPGAVSRFAGKMGMDIDEEAAAKIVMDWRETNPKIVTFWEKLDRALHDVVERGLLRSGFKLPYDDLEVEIDEINTPKSLRQQMPAAKSIALRVWRHGQTGDVVVMQRVFQGAFMDGRDVCYHKASERKTGDLWMERWHKDGQSGRWKIYGGKLAGILTQSFCRELFFRSLRAVSTTFHTVPNVRLIGQFHDEIVLDYTPFGLTGDDTITRTERTLKQVLDTMAQLMSDPLEFVSFPLAAEIKSDYRYTK